MTEIIFRLRLRLRLSRVIGKLELYVARVRFTFARLYRFTARKPFPRIKTTYEIITQASAAEGDVAENGWLDEDGVSCVPDAYDIADGKTCVQLAIEFLSDKSLEASASFFHSGVWYTEYESNEGTRNYYETGDIENRAYHLYGFTVEQESLIFEGVKA